MKAKLVVVFAVIVFIFSSVMVVSAETQTSFWREEMNYQSLNQLEAGGWTVTHEDGVSFSGSAIVLDGTSQDTAIHYQQKFPSGISNWKVEDKSRWTLGSHCGNIVTAITDKHSYSFQADGWYSTYVFYRDGQKTTFGSFQENKNTWFTLAIEKQGNQINMYYNGEIKSTYTETDTSASQLIGVDAVSPWRGGSEYDYFEVWQIGDTSTQEAQQSLLSNPIVIGSIIGVVGVGVGGVLYFFVLGGSGGTSGSAGAGATGDGLVQNPPTSTTDAGAITGVYNQQISNVSDINSIFQDFTQSVNNILSQNNQVLNQMLQNSGNPTLSELAQDPIFGDLISALVVNPPQSVLPSLSSMLSGIPGSEIGSLSTLQDINTYIANMNETATPIINGQPITDQGTINQDSYQNYLEQTTNLLDALGQMVNTQQTATSNAANCSNR